MKPYASIRNVFKRDPDNNYKTLLWGEWDNFMFEQLWNMKWVWTEKLDGTNIRIINEPDENGNPQFRIRGRSDNAQIPTPLQHNILHSVEYLIDCVQCASGDTPIDFHAPFTLYGEGLGPGIQKGGRYGQVPKFVLFDVWQDCWCSRTTVQQVAKEFDLEYAKVVGEGDLMYMAEIVRGKNEEALRSAYGDFLMEGFVARPSVELMHRDRRVITKCKVKDFP